MAEKQKVFRSIANKTYIYFYIFILILFELNIYKNFKKCFDLYMLNKQATSWIIHYTHCCLIKLEFIKTKNINIHSKEIKFKQIISISYFMTHLNLNQLFFIFKVKNAFFSHRHRLNDISCKYQHLIHWNHILLWKMIISNWQTCSLNNLLPCQFTAFKINSCKKNSIK